MLCAILKAASHTARYTTNRSLLDHEKKVLNDFCRKLSTMVKMAEAKLRKMHNYESGNVEGVKVPLMESVHRQIVSVFYLWRSSRVVTHY